MNSLEQSESANRRSPASGLLDCPTCGTQPETRGWQTYCPTCLLEAPPGEVPDECEANWNKMITGQSNGTDAENRRENLNLKYANWQSNC